MKHGKKATGGGPATVDSVAGLAPASYNPRKIDDASIKALATCMARFGDLSGIVFNTTTRRLVCGHQRTKNLPASAPVLMAEQHKDAVGTVGYGYAEVEGVRWPVRFVAWDEPTEKAANVAANSPLLQGTYTPGLAPILAELSRDLPELSTALRLGELEVPLELPAVAGDDGADPKIDQAAELLKVWKIKPGDLWTMGKHRLLCGDSTKADDVKRLMNGERAGLMNTDPPYGVDYAAVKNGIPRSGFKDIQARGGDIANDDLTDGAALQAFLESAIRAAVPALTGNCAFYLWHPMLTQGTFFAAAAAAADILIHRQIIWVKPHMVLTRSGMYHWKHELCFYGWVRGKPCPWYGDKSQVSVWEIGEKQQGRVHPTQKPVEIFARPMLNHLRIGEIAYEPFAGSGSQIIAAEQLKRRCYAIEIEPKYCAVILQRFLDTTGVTPERVTA